MEEKAKRDIKAFGKEALIRRRLLRNVIILVGGLTMATCLGDSMVAPYSLAQTGQTIVDEWATVQAPKPPELKPLTLDPKTTALLVLDIIKQSCNII